MGATIFSPTIFRKIFAVLCVVCKGLNSNQNCKTFLNTSKITSKVVSPIVTYITFIHKMPITNISQFSKSARLFIIALGQHNCDMYQNCNECRVLVSSRSAKVSNSTPYLYSSTFFVYVRVQTSRRIYLWGELF